MDSRSQLLSTVVRSHRNAGKKISRLKQKDVLIGGTRLDPRQNLADVRKMSDTQLRQYSQRLGEFNSRGNSYVAGASGAALSKAKFERYKDLEKRFNANLKTKIDSIKDITIPGNSLTIGERYNRMVPKGRSISGASSRFHPYNRSAKGFPGNKALDKAIEDLEKRMVPGFSTEQDAKLRENFTNLMKYSGRDDLLKAAEALTAEQFDILWSFDNMVSSITENYSALKDMLSGADDSLEAEAINEIYDEVLVKMREIKKKKMFVDNPKKPRKGRKR